MVYIKRTKEVAQTASAAPSLHHTENSNSCSFVYDNNNNDDDDNNNNKAHVQASLFSGILVVRARESSIYYITYIEFNKFHEHASC